MSRPDWATCLDQENIWNGWALNHDSAVAVALMLEDLRPGRTFESGSGSSTILFSQYAEAHGAHHTAFESSAEYRTATLQLLTRYGTGTRTEILHTPLLNSPHGPWYSAPAPATMDFALIDGPRQQDGGRNAALFHIRDSLTDNATLVLDDTDRPDEQMVLETWKEEFGLDFSPLPNTTQSTSYCTLRTERA